MSPTSVARPTPIVSHKRKGWERCSHLQVSIVAGYFAAASWLHLPASLKMAHVMILASWPPPGFDQSQTPSAKTAFSCVI